MIVSDVNKEKAMAIFGNKLVEGYYDNFNLYDLRILALIASLVSPDDDDFKTYRISASVVSELTGINTNMYQVIKKAMSSLLDKKIFIKTEDRLIGMNVFKTAEYIYKEGCFEVALNEMLRPFLLKLKERFTKIPLKYSLPLGSTYAFRVYELLKQYEDTGYRKDDITELRKMLGIKDKEYARFVDFEKRVLKVAEREINEKTDLIVSYQKQKSGKRVTHIIWDIRKKTEEEIAKVVNMNIDSKKKAIWDYITENYVVLIYPYDETRKSDMESFNNNAFDFRIKRVSKNDKDFAYVLCIDEKEADEYINAFGEPERKRSLTDKKTKIETLFRFSEFILIMNNNNKFVDNFYNYMKKRGLFKEKD